MSTTARFFFLVGILFLVACSASQPPAADQTTPKPVSPPQGAAVSSTIPATEAQTSLLDIPGTSADLVRNSEYQLGFLDQVRYVQLTDGRYQEGTPGSADYISVSMTDFIAWGDLNDDGVDETVAIVAENYGGSGTFVFLVVYQSQEDGLSFLTSTFLDDRPLVNALSVEEGEILVDAIIHASDDPMCCPTLYTARHYFLNGVNLILSDYSTKTAAGEPRVITIEAPVNGIQISGIVRLKGNITIAPFENNLVYRVYDLGGVELSAGPITVESTGLGAPGEFEKAVDLGNILKDTMVRITVEDIGAADGSLSAMDSVLLQVK